MSAILGAINMVLRLLVLLCLFFPAFAQAQSMSSLQTYFTDATDCTTDATIATKARVTSRCIDLDDMTEWMCSDPTGGTSGVLCDRAVEWARIGARICSDATN